MFWALSSNNDFFKQKVSLFMALGPVANMKHSKSPLLSFMAWNIDIIAPPLDLLGIYEFFPANFLTTGAFRAVCWTIPDLCKFGASLVADSDPDLDDTDRFTVYMGHFPSGTSRRCLFHYAQIMNAEKFLQYDFGDPAANKRIYGQTTPPEIDMTKVEGVPVAMFVGTKDELADILDNRWLRDQLGKAVVHYDEYNMGHLTFMVGKDASWFTGKGLDLLKEYHPL